MRIIVTTLVLASLVIACDGDKDASRTPAATATAATAATAPPSRAPGGGPGGAQGAGLRFEVPADFPIELPAGASQVVYTDDTANGQRQRTVVFQGGGSRQQLIAHFDKEMRADGLEPVVQDVDFGASPVTNVSAEKGRLKVQIGIFEDTPGKPKVVIAWMERLD